MTYSQKSNLQDGEKFMKNLFQESFVPESPSEQFDKSLMDKVMYDWVSRAGTKESLVDKRNQLWLFVGVVLVLGVGFLIDMGRLSGQYVDQTLWYKGFAQLGALLFGWMASMHWLIPSAVAAIAGLLLFDRLLQRLSRR